MNLRVIAVRKNLPFLLAIFTLWSLPAYSDVVWPALYLEMRLLSIPAIVLGLAIEGVIYALGLGLGRKRAAIFDISVNAISTLAGMIAIPIAGIIWEHFTGIFMYKHFNIGSFNPITWIFTYIVAVIITASIEVLAARKLFELGMTHKETMVIVWANAASVGIAFISLFLFPITP